MGCPFISDSYVTCINTWFHVHSVSNLYPMLKLQLAGGASNVPSLGPNILGGVQLWKDDPINQNLPNNCWSNHIHCILVGGFKHLETYWPMGRIIPYIMENKTCSKPPTNYSISVCLHCIPLLSMTFPMIYPHDIPMICLLPSSNLT